MDAIDRQAAIDKINERQRKLIYCFGFENDMVKIMDIARSIIIAMPSVQPERKKGKWIYKSELGWGETWLCSECGEKTTSTIMGKPRYNWCPMCGADMRGDSNV